MRSLNRVLSARRRYTTSFYQKVVSVFSSLLLCKTKGQRKQLKQNNNAKERLSDELDCVQIIKSIRELKVLTKLILDQHQRQLLGFSKYNVITDQPSLKEDKTHIENWVPDKKSGLKGFSYKLKIKVFTDHWKNSDISPIAMKLFNEGKFKRFNEILLKYSFIRRRQQGC